MPSSTGYSLNPSAPISTPSDSGTFSGTYDLKTCFVTTITIKSTTVPGLNETWSGSAVSGVIGWPVYNLEVNYQNDGASNGWGCDGVTPNAGSESENAVGQLWLGTGTCAIVVK